MEKLSFKQLREYIIAEELEYKSFIDALLNIKFKNRLCRLIYFYMSEQ